MNFIEKFKIFSEKISSDIKYNEPMSNYTSFKTGGNADIIVSPSSFEDLDLIVHFCKDNNIKPFILGNGSNLLVRDDGIRGIVIHIGKEFDDIRLIDETTIECLSGTSLIKLCRFAFSSCAHR